MNRLVLVVLSMSAALLLAVPALAQTTPGRNPAVENEGRIDRHCTSSTLATDPSAPCSDDALNSRAAVSTHQAIRPAISAKSSSGKTTQPGSGKTGKTSTATKGATVVQEPAR